MCAGILFFSSLQRKRATAQQHHNRTNAFVCCCYGGWEGSSHGGWRGGGGRRGKGGKLGVALVDGKYLQGIVAVHRRCCAGELVLRIVNEQQKNIKEDKNVGLEWS